jgi:hypothetical protein
MSVEHSIQYYRNYTECFAISVDDRYICLLLLGLCGVIGFVLSVVICECFVNTPLNVQCTKCLAYIECNCKLYRGNIYLSRVTHSVEIVPSVL